MKKKLIIWSICLLILGNITLSSCQKKQNRDGMIVGLYLECLNDQNYTLTDNNPKIYIDVKKNNIFTETTGNTGKSLSFESTSKVINEISDINFSGTLVVPNNSFEQINIHLLIYKNNEYIVEEDVLKTMEIKSGSYTFQESYFYNNLTYQIQISFKLRVKEYY